MARDEVYIEEFNWRATLRAEDPEQYKSRN